MSAENSNVHTIAIDGIVVENEWNTRGGEAPDPKGVKELAADIKAKGLIQLPAVCKLSDGKYKLIAGFRRMAALKYLKRTHVDCTVFDEMPEEEMLAINLSENLQRENLDIIQETMALKRFKDAGYTRQDVMRKLNKTNGWTQVRWMILALPEELHEDIRAGTITQSNIRSLYSIWNSTQSKEDVFSAVRDVKVKKQRGMRNVQVKVSQVNKKCMRTRTEIFELQEELFNFAGPSVSVKALAWAAGEISDVELHDYLVAKGIRE